MSGPTCDSPKGDQAVQTDINYTYWENFISSSPVNRKTLQNNPSFVRHLWCGIPESLRGSVWSALITISPNLQFRNETNDAYKMDFESEVVYVTAQKNINVNSPEVHSSRVILDIDATTNKLDAVRHNCLDIAFAMHNVTSNVPLLVQAHTTIIEKLNEVGKDDFAIFSTWIRYLLEALKLHAPVTAQMLMRSNIDLYDLEVMLRQWYPCFSTDKFDTFIAKRCVDILLFDPAGSVALIGIFAAVLVCSSMDILDTPEDDREELLEVLLKNKFKYPEDLFTVGYNVFRHHIDAIFKIPLSGEIILENYYISLTNSCTEPYNSTAMSLQNVANRYHFLNDYRKSFNQMGINVNDSSINITEMKTSDVIKLKLAQQALEGLARHNSTCTSNIITALSDIKATLAKIKHANGNHADTVAFATPFYGQHPYHSDPFFCPRRVDETGIIKYSELMEYLTLPCAHMEGYVFKVDQVNKKPITQASLHKRFFVLNGYFLTIFRSHESVSPIRDVSVDLRGRRISLVESKHLDGYYGIEILTHSQRIMYRFFVRNEELRNKWCTSLRFASSSPRYIIGEPNIQDEDNEKLRKQIENFQKQQEGKDKDGVDVANDDDSPPGRSKSEIEIQQARILEIQKKHETYLLHRAKDQAARPVKPIKEGYSKSSGLTYTNDDPNMNNSYFETITSDGQMFELMQPLIFIQAPSTTVEVTEVGLISSLRNSRRSYGTLKHRKVIAPSRANKTFNQPL